MGWPGHAYVGAGLFFTPCSHRHMAGICSERGIYTKQQPHTKAVDSEACPKQPYTLPTGTANFLPWGTAAF